MEPCTAPRVSGAARLLLSGMDHPAAKWVAWAPCLGTHSHIRDPLRRPSARTQSQRDKRQSTVGKRHAGKRTPVLKAKNDRLLPRRTPYGKAGGKNSDGPTEAQ